jgi:hypothetical protein
VDRDQKLQQERESQQHHQSVSFGRQARRDREKERDKQRLAEWKAEREEAKRQQTDEATKHRQVLVES